MFAEKDCIIGISNDLIMGHIALLGTAAFDVILDVQQSIWFDHIDSISHEVNCFRIFVLEGLMVETKTVQAECSLMQIIISSFYTDVFYLRRSFEKFIFSPLIDGQEFIHLKMYSRHYTFCCTNTEAFKKIVFFLSVNSLQTSTFSTVFLVYSPPVNQRRENKLFKASS
jgi:hypothetical protein